MIRNTNSKSRWFLLFCAAGLVPIALGYGASPERIVPMLLGITVDKLELAHVLRAIMGLYLGMAALWVVGALRAHYTRPALIACGVFMLGLAAGRVISLVADGIPQPLLLIYLALEVLLGSLAFVILKQMERPS